MRAHLSILYRSGLMFCVRLGGAGIIFLVQAAIARAWGSEVLADYMVLIAVVNIAGMIMPLGFQTIGSYFAVEYRAAGRKADLLKFVRRAYAQIGISAVLMAVAAWAVQQWTSWLSGNMAGLVIPGFVFAVSLASVVVNSALLVGLRHQVAGLMADGIARPLVVLAGFVAATMTTGTVPLVAMLWVIAAGYALAALVCLAMTFGAISRLDATLPQRPGESARWHRFAAPWVIIAISTEFFFDIDLLLLSMLLDKHDLAVFGITTRIFALLAFAITIVYALLLPDMMEADASRDRSAFVKRMNDANLAAFCMSLALMLAALIAGPFALSVAGPDFAHGRWLLVILSAILALRAFFGPAELVLSLHDRPWATVPAIAAGLLTLVAGNVLLVPAWGITGAGVAALAATLVWSLVKWHKVLVTTGLDVSLMARYRPAQAATTSRTGNAAGS
jgi:O-antigen/teichoic acid export membrane protein